MRNEMIEIRTRPGGEGRVGPHTQEEGGPRRVKEFGPTVPGELRAALEDPEETGESLRDSEERLRLTIESIRDQAIYTLDPEGRVVSWNTGAERIKGYSSEEILGKSFSRFYTLEDIASGKPDRALILARNGGRFEEEGPRVRKDGEVFWASVAITALRDRHGSLRGYAGVTQDITERRTAEEALRRSRDELEALIQDRSAELSEANRKLRAEVAGRRRAQEALEKSERRFRALIRNSSDAISLLGVDGTVLFASSALYKILGYAAEESIGQKVFDRAHPDDLEGVRTFFLHLLQAANSVQTIQFRCRHRDGAWRWIEGVCTNLLHDPAVEGIVANYRDITGRKEAEEELSRLASIVESSDDAIIGETMEGIIVSWNRGAERIYGYTSEEVQGCHISILAPLDRLNEMPAVFDQLRQGRSVEPFETIRLQKDGGRIDVTMAASPIEYGTGKIVGVSLISRDIPRERLLQRALAQAGVCAASGVPGASDGPTPGPARTFRSAPGEAGTSTPAAMPRARGSETILIVEDEEAVLNIGKAMLEALGYTVLTASDGEEALRIYRSQGRDIAGVLTDIVMPRMGGVALCGALRQADPTVRVLLMTGYNLSKDVMGLLDGGAKGFLQKPFDLGRLSEAVRRALDS